MSVIYKVGEQEIVPGKPWTDADGFQHPANWTLWSDEEKAERNIAEIKLETPPDSRIFDWSHNDDGSIKKSAKPLGQVKASLSARIKEQQFLLLNKTDWAVIRKADSGAEIPNDIATWRAAIRSKGDEKEDKIAGAADVDALADLLASGLFDWPVLK